MTSASNIITASIGGRPPWLRSDRASAASNSARNISKSTTAEIRAAVEHVFAHRKARFGLSIRTIGLARAEAKLTLANIAYNMDRPIFHERRAAMG